MYCRSTCVAARGGLLGRSDRLQREGGWPIDRVLLYNSTLESLLDHIKVNTEMVAMTPGGA